MCMLSWLQRRSVFHAIWCACSSALQVRYWQKISTFPFMRCDRRRTLTSSQIIEQFLYGLPYGCDAQTSDTTTKWKLSRVHNLHAMLAFLYSEHLLLLASVLMDSIVFGSFWPERRFSQCPDKKPGEKHHVKPFVFLSRSKNAWVGFKWEVASIIGECYDRDAGVIPFACWQWWIQASAIDR